MDSNDITLKLLALCGQFAWCSADQQTPKELYWSIT